MYKAQTYNELFMECFSLLNSNSEALEWGQNKKRRNQQEEEIFEGADSSIEKCDQE